MSVSIRKIKHRNHRFEKRRAAARLRALKLAVIAAITQDLLSSSEPPSKTEPELEPCPQSESDLCESATEPERAKDLRQFHASGARHWRCRQLKFEAPKPARHFVFRRIEPPMGIKFGKTSKTRFSRLGFSDSKRPDGQRRSP